MSSSQTAAAAKKRKQAGQAKFYAVRAGHTPGIYTTWKECETNITGFKGAVYKSFPSQNEAADFVAGREPDVEPNGTTKYYGVASGHVPGVYTSWAAAQAQIVGMKGPKYKKFATREEAEAFVSGGGKSLPPTPQAKTKAPASAKRKKEVEGFEADDRVVQPRQKKKARRVEDVFAFPSDDELVEDADDSGAELEMQLKASANEYIEAYDVVDEDESAMDSSHLKIYTDGSSRGNGKLGAVAGVGVFFGKNDKRNVSEPLEGLPQTNQRAELAAILRALQIAPVQTEVSIYTDSQYSIQCVTQWHRKWERCDWKTATGQPVLNQDLIQGVLEKTRERLALKAKTNFVKVKGHSNDPGNEAADALATAGSQMAQIALANSRR